MRIRRHIFSCLENKYEWCGCDHRQQQKIMTILSFCNIQFCKCIQSSCSKHTDCGSLSGHLYNLHNMISICLHTSTATLRPPTVSHEQFHCFYNILFFVALLLWTLNTADSGMWPAAKWKRKRWQEKKNKSRHVRVRVCVTRDNISQQLPIWENYSTRVSLLLSERVCLNWFQWSPNDPLSCRGGCCLLSFMMILPWFFSTYSHLLLFFRILVLWLL